MKKKLQLEPLKSWIQVDGPLIISGPCSAESESQMVDTAKLLAALDKVHILRAGIWKPRTRPGQYEGGGVKALDWLIKAKAETGLPVATEVATATHVEKCLEAGIDILWVGARTTANPFSVQEVADSLRGTDIPVLVKNPISPDIDLWIGALERLNRAGIKKLVAIHRGFSSFDSGPFRNAPMWDISIKLKTMFPELPILCDPSHITGNREMIPFIAQKAIDLNMAGLMIESHIEPAEALSDAKQQVYPSVLGDILTNLIIRKPSSISKEFRDTLEVFRKQIDSIDAHILNTVADRMKIVEQIGHHKRLNKVTVFQVGRLEQTIKMWLHSGNALGLDDSFIKNLLNLIHYESVQIQQKVMNSTHKKI